MYSPLAPDPLPPGPRVTNPLAPLLRLLLRLFNVALAALALLLIGTALWMGQQYRHGGGGGGDAPAPEASAAAAQGGAGAATLSAGAAGAAAASFPWFIYFVGATGAYCLVTALCGLAGAKRDRRLHLATYILLLALLALAEAGATLLLLTDNAWRDAIPGGAGCVAGLLFSCRRAVALLSCLAVLSVGLLGLPLRPLTRTAPLHPAMPPHRRPLGPLAPGAGVGGGQCPRCPPGGGGHAGR